MKNLFSKITLVALSALLMASVGCNREKGNGFSLTINEVGPAYVDILVSSPDPALKLAYELSSTEKKNDNAISLFASAKKANCVVDAKDGDIVRISNGIDQNTKYYLYMVAKMDEAYSEIVTLTFTTAPYDFDQLATIVSTAYDGYKVHLTLPESTRKAKNAIRFSQCCLMMYNYSKNFMKNDDYFNLLYNAGAYTVKDTTLVYSEDLNWYQEDEDADGDGNPDWNNHYNPISPGEPVVFLAGEYAWMEDTEEYENPYFQFPGGWENGYYLPLINTAYYAGGKSQSMVGTTDIDLTQPLDQFWTGAFQRKTLRTREPSLLEAKVNIDVTDIGPVNATVLFQPEEGVEQFAFGIFDAATYNQMMDLLGGNEDYLQWAITSYFAAYTLGTGVASGPTQMQLKDYFLDVPSESEIYVLATAMGNSEGTAQSFTQMKFSTTAKVLDAPVITVTPVLGEDGKGTSPYKAEFVVKSNMPLVKASYAANYVRDWKLAVNGGDSYYSLASSNYAFSNEEIAKICSAEGYKIEIPTVDGETTRMVVVGYNAENTPNDLNYQIIEECPAVADVTTPYVAPKTYVPSDLYETLVGDWTAKAILYNGEKRFEHKSKMTISSHDEDAGISAFEYPSTLEESVYAIYKKALKKEDDKEVREIVDGYWADFKKLAGNFGMYRLQDQNRLLCQGWMDKDSYNRLATQDPYDLFISEKYSSVDVSSIFYDFGPKWYIELSKGEDGNVKLSAPVDPNFLPPVASWHQSVRFDMVAIDPETMYYIPNADVTRFEFPVEYDAEKDQIIVRPFVYKDVKYYPNVMGYDYSAGSNVLENPVVSEIVLTRGWTEKEQSSVSVAGKRISYTGSVVNSAVKPMTRLTAPVKYNEMEGSVMTLDKFKANADRLFENLKKQNN